MTKQHVIVLILQFHRPSVYLLIMEQEPLLAVHYSASVTKSTSTTWETNKPQEKHMWNSVCGDIKFKYRVELFFTCCNLSKINLEKSHWKKSVKSCSFRMHLNTCFTFSIRLDSMKFRVCAYIYAHITLGIVSNGFSE